MAKTSHQGKSTPTKPADASRAQSGVAKRNDGIVTKGGHVARLQRAAAHNYGKSGGK